MNIPVYKIPARFTIYLWNTVVLFCCISSDFVSFRIDGADTPISFVCVNNSSVFYMYCVILPF